MRTGVEGNSLLSSEMESRIRGNLREKGVKKDLLFPRRVFDLGHINQESLDRVVEVVSETSRDLSQRWRRYKEVLYIGIIENKLGYLLPIGIGNISPQTAGEMVRADLGESVLRLKRKNLPIPNDPLGNVFSSF